MKISYNWLKKYTGLDLPPDKIAGMLTGCGLEVENIETFQSIPGGFNNVVIGEVIECHPHPGSDHLSVTRVNIGGNEFLQIVCGASNVAAGQKVVVALADATLMSGGKELTIRKAKIRGVVSEGMICAEDELGLGTDHSGIMILPVNAIPGTPAKTYFGITEDTVFTIGLTPNRADAASHIGVARDLLAVCNNFGNDQPRNDKKKSLILPDVSAFREGDGSFEILVDVVNQEACPRYSGITISGITIAESPAWLKNFLNAVGLRPINNIVDITNFVLMELGQPLHAFDAGKINGNRVVVRKCTKGTRFITLDEIERTLSADDLMICDAETPMCIGGVFGGIGSGITSETRAVFLESACFDPVHIRRTSRYHGLQTDASFRFERGTDPDITLFALKRATLLILELAGGKVTSPIIDHYPVPVKPFTVTLAYHQMNRLIGKMINRDVVRSILEDLGITMLSCTDDELVAEVPPFKVDVAREADLIEEILRIYGYNNIEISQEIHASLSYALVPDRCKVREVLSGFLASNGFLEIMNNSLTCSALYEGNPVYPAGNGVRILNPLSRDLDIMRQTLLYGGVETIVYNCNRKNNDLKLFEIGTVYSRTTNQTLSVPVSGYRESEQLALFLTGRSVGENWNTAGRPVDLYLMKGYVFALLKRIGINPDTLTLTPFNNALISEGVEFSSKGETCILMGSVSPTVLKNMDCRQPVLYASLDLNVLMRLLPERDMQYQELPRFPEVRRDLALLVDRHITFGMLRDLAFQTERKLLRHVNLFDVYEGEKIGEEKKSYALAFHLRDDRKTLTDEEIEKVMDRLIRTYTNTLNAQIR